MSVQFGRWNFDGRPTVPEYIDNVTQTLALCGPDGSGRYSKGGINILYWALHTTREAHNETQPHTSPSGAVITWDGVLDNREELVRELRDSLTMNSPDVSIVSAAYEKWGDKSFAKLIGDWALSIWNPAQQSILFARDQTGNHHLFYMIEKNYLAWCTVLDPLVRFAGKTFKICEEYIAGWFVRPAFPAAHLTPYVGLNDVPPSSLVRVQLGKHGVRHTVGNYWNFDPGKKIRYRTDAEYEEHFRTVFAQAVQRKLRSDRPILAELSGGMDSSSIVCMADTVIASGQAGCPRLDTISWYDDSYDHLEPDTNELHWLSKVEEKRGRAGFHINYRDVNAMESGRPPIPFASQFDTDHFAVTPVPTNVAPSELFKRCKAHIESQGYRIILSGIGGDETTGAGVPTPTPELQNLLVRGRFLTLIRQLNAWAAKMKKPRLPLLWEAVQDFFTVPLEDVFADALKTPWLTPSFVRQNRAALCGYPRRIKLFGPLPSFQGHLEELDRGRRIFAARGGSSSELLAEMRYPFFDRDFREFVYAIPREQIVGIGKRRYLLKRALAGIVPDEILNRKRKPFVPPESSSEPKKDLSRTWPSSAEMGAHIMAGSVGVVDPVRFLEALEKTRRNESAPPSGLERTLTLEFWLRHLAAHGVLTSPSPTKGSGYSPRVQPSRQSVLVPLGADEQQTAPLSRKVSAG